MNRLMRRASGLYQPSRGADNRLARKTMNNSMPISSESVSAGIPGHSSQHGKSRPYLIPLRCVIILSFLLTKRVNRRLNSRSLSSAVKWTLLGLAQAGPVAAAEPQNPEQYKEELLAIEKRLDAKLKALDDKLKLLDKLESAPATATATVPPEKAMPAKAEESTLVQAAEEQKSEKPKSKSKSGIPAGLSYGKNGFEFRTDNDLFSDVFRSFAVECIGRGNAFFPIRYRIS